MKKLLIILIALPMIGFGQEGIWTIDGGVRYQVIVDRLIDVKDGTIEVNIPNIKGNLFSVDMIIQHKDDKTRFIFKNFRTERSSTGVIVPIGNMAIAASSTSTSYERHMIKTYTPNNSWDKKLKFKRWMEKYGKRNISTYFNKYIENIYNNDGWE
tara:strand:- start:53 stop:517 length:465 start_codon:yes stop_codon:yes gene_type:complete